MLSSRLKFRIKNLKLGYSIGKLSSILLLSSCILILHSCKLKYSFSGATIPPEAKSISVKYFDNQAPLAGPMSSQLLTEALRDIIQTQTRLSLTDKNADLEFEGAITGYSTAPVAIQSNDQAALNRLTITINVKYINKFDESKNFESTFTRFADFQSNVSLAVVENQLIQEINTQLVQDIFNRAFNNW
ncbi:MAG: LptE family protein [Bacteroidetes bacterium]|nr:LptE family protein [Bacteroidota bacterium]